MSRRKWYIYILGKGELGANAKPPALQLAIDCCDDVLWMWKILSEKEKEQNCLAPLYDRISIII